MEHFYGPGLEHGCPALVLSNPLEWMPYFKSRGGKEGKEVGRERGREGKGDGRKEGGGK